MNRIAIIYSSKEGQTARIARKMAALIRTESNNRVTVLSLEDHEGEIDLSPYHGVIIGGSVHQGHHAKELVDFVSGHQFVLRRIPSAFYSVSLSAAGGPEQREDALGMVREFLEKTGWKPEQSGIFGGALLYRRYNFVLRWIMRRIVKKTGGDIDSSRDYEYTNWNSVKLFMRGYMEENFA